MSARHVELWLCWGEGFYLRMFVRGAEIHKLSTVPDGTTRVSDGIITAAIYGFAKWWSNKPFEWTKRTYGYPNAFVSAWGKLDHCSEHSAWPDGYFVYSLM